MAKKKKINLTGFNKLRSRIWKAGSERIPSYKKTADIASYVNERIQNRKKKGPVTNAYVKRATTDYFKDQEQKRIQAAAKKRTSGLKRFNKLRSKIWERDGENIESYADTARIASYVNQKIKSRKKKGPVSDRYIHEQTQGFFTARERDIKQKAEKRRKDKLSAFNKLRSRIWALSGDLIDKYSQTAKVASYVEGRRKADHLRRGSLSDDYIRQAVEQYFKQFGPPPPAPEEEIPEGPTPPPAGPSEEEELPEEEVPFGLFPEEPLLDEYFSNPFPYYDLDQAMDFLVHSIYEKDILVRSPLSTLSEFRLNDYDYADTFKTYVDELNGTLGDITSETAPEVMLVTRYDEKLGTWFIWIYEVGFEPGEYTSEGSDLPSVVRDIQKRGEEIEQENLEKEAGAAKEKPAKKGKKEKAPPIISIPTPEKMSFQERKELTEWKRKEMDRIQKAMDQLRNFQRELMQDVRNYQSLGNMDEMKKAMEELSLITSQVYKLNREFIRISNSGK